MPKTPYLRNQGEEHLNALIHAIGLGLSIAGLVCLASLTAHQEWMVHAAAVIFGATMSMTYLTSTLYHGNEDPIKRRRYRMLDHVSIYTAIAGGYTPLTLLCVPHPKGIIIFSIIWILAGIGIIYKVRNLGKNEFLSAAGYVVLGWCGLVMIPDLIETLPGLAGEWILVGGMSYTLGVFFYWRDYKRFYHTIWHVLTMVGSLCHFIAVYCYILR